MISEGSCGTEDWSEITAIEIENSYFKLQHYLTILLYQINAALVSIRDFLQK